MEGLDFVDSHTAGEPTRVVVAGGPPLGTGSLCDRRAQMQSEFDHYRRWVILEPRGNDALVGALLCKPVDTQCAAGVIFFNNAGYLGMCGHGMMGVAVTLARLGRISTGVCRIETPVGVVEVNLLSPSRVAIENVPAYRFRKQVPVDVPGMGTLVGDVAWGGNWFYLVEESPLPLRFANVEELTAATRRTLAALKLQSITGQGGAEIDHVELFGPPAADDANSRNFVMCPGGAYDRSPCGTGTSAKLACLAADGKLAPGDRWVQEGILGSRFVGHYRAGGNGQVVPTIEGEAYVTAEGRLLADPLDPFRHGITPEGVA